MSYETAARLVLARMKVEATEERREAEKRTAFCLADGKKKALLQFERRVGEEIRKETA